MSTHYVPGKANPYFPKHKYHGGPQRPQLEASIRGIAAGGGVE
jgi:hypothetical protein